MADIFISYSREDRDLIGLLADRLEAAGFSVWWDRNIGGGAEFSRTIETELGAAKTVIVAWSSASLDSHWVRDEADYARGDGKLLPLSLDGVLPPLGFRQLHALDFKGWDQSVNHAAFVALLSSLGKQSSSPALGTPQDKAQRVKPSIAVLPFVNMSTDEEVGFVADGLAEDIITSLSANQHISVAARTSSFAYKNQSADIRDIGKALGARYVVGGSVRKMGQRARITARFVGVETGAQLWAKKFDEVLDELYEQPDDLVERISGSVFAQLTWAEAERAGNLPEEELGIWEHCQRAVGSIGRIAVSAKVMHRVIDELEKAVAITPEYNLAHAVLSWTYNVALVNGVYDDDQYATFVAKAKTHLRIARSWAKDDLYCLTWIGTSETFGGMHERAVSTLEHVLRRNPASADALFAISQAYAYLGRHDEAHKAMERAIVIAPEGGLSRFYSWYLGFLGHLAGNYETSLPLTKAHAALCPDYGLCNVLAAIDCVLLGDEAEAKKYIVRAKQHNPQLRPQKLSSMLVSQFDKEKGAREYAILEKLWADK